MTRKLLILLIAALGLLDSNILGQGIESSIGGGTSSGGSGTGTVTHTAGALTADAVVVGAGAADTVASNCTKAAGQPLTCVDGFSTGTGGAGLGIQLSGATSGLATIKPPAVAGTPTFTLPGTTDTVLMGRYTPVLAAQLPFLNIGPPPGSIYRVIKVDNAASGDVDFYTTPSGYRTAVSSLTCFNSAGTTTAAYPEIKLTDTTYRRLTANASAATLTTTNLSHGILFEAGESVSANFAQAGMNCSGLFIDYLTSFPLRSVKLTTLASGDNTVYTVPAGVTSMGANPSGSLGQGGTGSWATTGGATATWYLVSSGGSSGTANRATPATAVGGNAVNALSPFKAGATGDFLVLNLNTVAGVNIAWVTVAEPPLP